MASWVEQVFDGRAARYDESAMHHALASAVAGFATVDPSESILDVATGTGLVLRALPRPPYEATRMAGVDLSARMLAVAAGHLPGADLRQADAAALPYANASFDVVTCVAALPYLDDATAALREWARCMKPGGRIVLSAFIAGGITGGALRAEAAAAEGLRVDDPNAPWGSVQALEAFAGAAGLTVVDTRAWEVQVEPMSADSLVSGGYPLRARDDLLTAPDQQIVLVRQRLAALIEQQPEWSTSALLVEMRGRAA